MLGLHVLCYICKRIPVEVNYYLLSPFFCSKIFLWIYLSRLAFLVYYSGCSSEVEKKKKTMEEEVSKMS